MNSRVFRSIQTIRHPGAKLYRLTLGRCLYCRSHVGGNHNDCRSHITHSYRWDLVTGSRVALKTSKSAQYAVDSSAPLRFHRCSQPAANRDVQCREMSGDTVTYLPGVPPVAAERHLFFWKPWRLYWLMLFRAPNVGLPTYLHTYSTAIGDSCFPWRWRRLLSYNRVFFLNWNTNNLDLSCVDVRPRCNDLPRWWDYIRPITGLGPELPSHIFLHSQSRWICLKPRRSR